MRVFLNAQAGHGRAAETWERLRISLAEQVGSFDEEPSSSLEQVSRSVRRAVDGGERNLVAAGGDGTVNLLLNAVMRLGDPSAVTLGAVALGSSNDFHKQRAEGASIDGVPVRVDCARARPTDVIRIDAVDDRGESRISYAVINASLGITAEANAHFNAGSRLVRAAGRLSVDAAIVASVLETLATYRDIQCQIALDGAGLGAFAVSNLGVIKNPHFAGSFCYDTAIEPDDGLLGVNLCERLTPFQALVTLGALSRSRFRGRPKTRCWTGTRVSVDADRAFALETDGEVMRARRAEFSVVPRAVRCCR